MSKSKKLLFKPTNKKQKKYIYSILAGLSILATCFVADILMLPLEKTETHTENTVIQETVFTFKADIDAFGLHPKGGIIDLEHESFTAVTNDVIVHITSSIKSDKPIKVNGSKEVILNLVATELWQKDYLLGEEDSFELEGTNIKLIDKDYPINLEQLTSFMKEVEGSINATPPSYSFEITPVITGNVIYNGMEIPITHNAKTNIEYSQLRIIIGDETSFITTTPISNTYTIQHVFPLFGMKVPLLLVKVVCAVMYLMVLAAVLMAFRHIKGLYPAKSRSEYEKIDKKYKARMVSVLQSNIAAIDSNKRIIVDSFASLLKISDEKDAIIYTYEESEGELKDYYVIDEGYVFIYQTGALSDHYAGVGNSHV